jgi:hypothetical protein
MWDRESLKRWPECGPGGTCRTLRARACHRSHSQSHTARLTARSDPGDDTVRENTRHTEGLTSELNSLRVELRGDAHTRTEG